MKKVFSVFVFFVFANCIFASENPFEQNGVYKWKTNARGSNGTFKVTKISGNSFWLEQENVAFPQYGVAKFQGTIEGDTVNIRNVTYNEKWVGTLNGDKISGKVNNYFTFEISGVSHRNLDKPAKNPMPEENKLSSTAPFIKGHKLAWSTSIRQSGAMTVVSVDGNKFVVDQTNVKNTGAGAVRLDGEVFADGSCKLTNKKWGETWKGKINGGVVTGKVNGWTSFKIVGAASKPKPQKPTPSNGLFSEGNNLGWTTTRGQEGDIFVASSDGKIFVLEQSNKKNKYAGIVKLNGVLKSDGTFTLENKKWHEIWTGKISGNEATGNVNNVYNFKIFFKSAKKATPEIDKPFVKDTPSAKPPVKPSVKPPVQYPDSPLEIGKKLKWSTSAMQHGTLTLTSIKGKQFTFDQTNDNNKGAGKVQLKGEVKADGKFYLYNKKWNETWVGSIKKDRVSGKVNNIYTFTIKE